MKRVLFALCSIFLVIFLTACTGTDPDESLVEVEVDRIQQTSLAPYLGTISFDMKDTRREGDYYYLNYTIMANAKDEFAELSLAEINDVMKTSLNELGYEAFDCGAKRAKCTIYNIVVNVGGNKYEIGQFDKTVKMNGNPYEDDTEDE
ncbi:hypothetical protein HNQ35_000310 [Cerasibacillus quisquiliarum]|uniref:DUF5067 domain-containing protein n=1 Tax=Cerasibacillus quisquiliarum TaxID=227865 RepID=A0A511UTR3_9BACI|nr:hypothetical protein [Cerasibacillus quisquiliarum]MBB5145121.1 hypothetical protein [Cerasibacillus quisquiliarum]GEN29989.1 hypothetical protein CQU01_02270 [Cerasibacillus quisquiliarum]